MQAISVVAVKWQTAHHYMLYHYLYVVYGSYKANRQKVLIIILDVVFYWITGHLSSLRCQEKKESQPSFQFGYFYCWVDRTSWLF